MDDQKPTSAPPLTRTFIADWRRYRNLSLRKLAREVGLSPSRISQIEQGKEPYHQRFLERCAEALKCRPVDLLSHAPGGTILGDDATGLEGAQPNYGATIRRLQDEIRWFREINALATDKLSLIELSINTLSTQSEECGQLIVAMADKFGQRNQR